MPRLQHVVGVDPVPAQPLGQQPGDGGLAAAAGANQKEGTRGEGRGAQGSPAARSPVGSPAKRTVSSLFFLLSARIATGDRARLTSRAHQLQRRLPAGEQLELQGRLAHEQIHAGDDVAAARPGLLDQQRRFRRVDGVEDDQARLEKAGVDGVSSTLGCMPTEVQLISMSQMTLCRAAQSTLRQPTSSASFCGCARGCGW